MLTLKSMAHCRSSRNIESFRSCRTATGIATSHWDGMRMYREEARLANREQQRIRLARQWGEHLECSQPTKAR
ncbi:MAG: hypothetical protein HZA78_11390 [Candidatus Schekmanbacteria bacterium]|nr:hypothetical protein [Candidatus Schekmanbacteria bacterium]